MLIEAGLFEAVVRVMEETMRDKTGKTRSRDVTKYSERNRKALRLTRVQKYTLLNKV